MTFKTNTLLGPSLPMDANVSSQPVLIDQVYGFAIEIASSGGTAAGSFQVQGSMADVTQAQASAGSITTWSSVGSAIVVAAAGNTITNFDAQYYKWMRVVFTKSTGASSDTFTVKYGLKGP
jgi:uncharacterized membrane-anchored protein